MAKPIKRGRRWYIKVRDAQGSWKREVTEARTKAEAELLQAEEAVKAERQRRRLEPLPSEADGTLAELCAWWLKKRCPPASRKREESRLGLHVIRGPLGPDNKPLGEPPALGLLPLTHLSDAALDEKFEAMIEAGRRPNTVNRLRAILRCVIEAAIKKDKWSGHNPVKKTDALEVIKESHATLTVEEVPLLLAKVPEQWLGFFAAAIYLALRKGEIAGLLKSHVNLAARVIAVTCSYEADRTKGRRGVESLPIPEPLVPHLERCMSSSPGPWVFPDAAGKGRKAHSKPEVILRNALKRAGLVQGFDHKCRWCPREGRKPNIERHPDDTLRRCSAAGCGKKLWATAVPRDMVFHGLRHSTATILLRAGVDIYRVQKILRHANIHTTIDTYGNLVVDDLRGAFQVFSPPPPPAPPSSPTDRSTGGPTNPPAVQATLRIARNA